MMDTDPTRPDLSLVDTEWMVDALAARTDAFVIAFIPAGNPESDFLDHAGSRAACLGMLEMLKARIMQRYLAENAEADAEDDDLADDDD
jgi:hypothetical protein